MDIKMNLFKQIRTAKLCWANKLVVNRNGVYDTGGQIRKNTRRDQFLTTTQTHSKTDQHNKCIFLKYTMTQNIIS
jgi:hypothetical protein